MAFPDLKHALDLRGPLMPALDEVRPVPSAPSIGEAVRAVRAATSPRSLRKALAELKALVNHAAHARSKRGERANLVAQLVLACELQPKLGLGPDDDVRTTRRRIDELLG